MYRPTELKDRGDVVTGLGVIEQVSGKVLDMLEFFKYFGWYTIEDTLIRVERVNFQSN